jgi:hypothetical protein
MSYADGHKIVPYLRIIVYIVNMLQTIRIIVIIIKTFISITPIIVLVLLLSYFSEGCNSDKLLLRVSRPTNCVYFKFVTEA